MSEIRDPMHKHGARVTKEGRLYTESKTISKIGHVSGDEADVGIAYLRHTVQAAATSEWVGAMWNNSDTNFVVSDIFVSGGDVGGGAATFKHELFFITSDEVTTVGTSEFTPLNPNRTSGKTPAIKAYQNDNNDMVLAASVDNSREFLDTRSGSGGYGMHIPVKDMVILGKNDGIAVKCECSSLGEKVRATIWGYFQEEDFE